MSWRNRLVTGWKALTQLGLEQVGLNAVYRAGLVLGAWKALTPPRQSSQPAGDFRPLFPVEGLRQQFQDFYCKYPHQKTALLTEAGEILNSQVRLFGGPPVPLQLSPPAPVRHWTAYETSPADWQADQDIKLVWEPARFAWAFILARAYFLTSDDIYAQGFWRHTDAFLDANPTNMGPNWSSGQEVALRLVALGFALTIFDASPRTTPERRARLLQAMVDHARRIPPTLLYARSQNNNHLITEALGLYTAAVLLPAHPSAARWRALGWRWLNRAFQTQIYPDGSYVQHSASYHRLMLQAALLFQYFARQQGDLIPAATLDNLAAAARWLLARLDTQTGRLPNLGSNDGACILPLTTSEISDYRSTAQSASLAFLKRPALPPGPWDEEALWLQEDHDTVENIQPKQEIRDPSILHSTSSRASLRAIYFSSRPSHADQLHVDLWYRGAAIVLDAGTYRYTAAPPWDNALVVAQVHNTLTFDGQDQMRRAGRFLYLDWAQARWLLQEDNLIEAEHDGYRRLGLTHRRSLESTGQDCWRVLDTVLASWPKFALPHTAVLHWLLPDWPWTLSGNRLVLRGTGFSVSLAATIDGVPAPAQPSVQIIRAGELLSGGGSFPPILGWHSPTYNLKLPALSYRLILDAQPPISIQTDFTFEVG